MPQFRRQTSNCCTSGRARPSSDLIARSAWTRRKQQQYGGRCGRIHAVGDRQVEGEVFAVTGLLLSDVSRCRACCNVSHAPQEISMSQSLLYSWAIIAPSIFGAFSGVYLRCEREKARELHEHALAHSSVLRAVCSLRPPPPSLSFPALVLAANFTSM